ncbi:hypothetical protein DRJ04_09260 [Candidatus Aerophobetes bacterium]|uniref:TraB family protein n=1 Tax=Aerophobetes bacterium TaxID=2030807 RepID=A0A662D4K1_UNCAE|nr:MAG: hypothetical protein DRJ04_09260 [Candidatus Aerophobetes bacterium]
MPLIIVPTSHVAEESLERVKNTIERFKPDVIAVELDIHRFILLEEKNKKSTDLRSSGFLNFAIYTLMKKLQIRLGKKTGIFPGSEMLLAIKIAEEKGIDVEFIDRDIRITLFKLQTIPIKEKIKLILFLLFGFSFSFKFDLKKIPPQDIVDKTVETLRRNFPCIYRILVTERDSYMAERIRSLMKTYKRVLVFVGAGHKKGLETLLFKEPQRPS